MEPLQHLNTYSCQKINRGKPKSSGCLLDGQQVETSYMHAIFLLNASFTTLYYGLDLHFFILAQYSSWLTQCYQLCDGLHNIEMPDQMNGCSHIISWQLLALVLPAQVEPTVYQRCVMLRRQAGRQDKGPLHHLKTQSTFGWPAQVVFHRVSNIYTFVVEWRSERTQCCQHLLCVCWQATIRHLHYNNIHASQLTQNLFCTFFFFIARYV